jgi:hypothetical protein
MDLTIAHMVLVHDRTALSLNNLVTAYVLIVVIVFRVGLFSAGGSHTHLESRHLDDPCFPRFGSCPTRSSDIVQRIMKTSSGHMVSAGFLRFISQTTALSHRHFLIPCRCCTEAWRIGGLWIPVAHNT